MKTIIATVTLAAMFTTYVIAQSAPEVIGIRVDTAPGALEASLRVDDRLIAAIGAIFQQKTTLVTHGAISEVKPIAELALAERKVRELVHIHSVAMLQNKRIIASQVFTVKLGYNLAQNIRIIRNQDGSLTLLVPQPKILSMESAPIEYIFVDDGLTHKNSNVDYQIVERTLRENAEKDTITLEGIDQAGKAMSTRFVDVLSGLGIKATISTSQLNDRNKEVKE
jgi:hypothetical protein